MAPVRKRSAPELRLSSAQPASSDGNARPPQFTSRVYTRVYYRTHIIIIVLVKRRRVSVVADYYSTPTCIIINCVRAAAGQGYLSIARAALVMVNFELVHEEDLICKVDLREYLSATPSTSSTAIYNCNK